MSSTRIYTQGAIGELVVVTTSASDVVVGWGIAAVVVGSGEVVVGSGLTAIVVVVVVVVVVGNSEVVEGTVGGVDVVDVDEIGVKGRAEQVAAGGLYRSSHTTFWQVDGLGAVDRRPGYCSPMIVNRTSTSRKTLQHRRWLMSSASATRLAILGL
jgi:hypothetical protein